MRSIRLEAALALVLAGCNGGDASDAGASGGLPTGGSGSLSEFFAEYVEAQCQRAAKCEPSGASLGEATCTRLRAAFETTEAPHLQLAVDDGRVIFQETDAKICLDLMKSSACTQGSLVEVSCDRVFAGTLFAGSPCSMSAECEIELFCDLSGACPGTCARRLALGAPCTSSLGCPAPQSCFDGKCTAPARIGDPCALKTEESEGRLCESGGFCLNDGLDDADAGLVCLDVAHVSVAMGQPCHPENGPVCRGELVCQLDDVQGGQPTFGCVPRVSEGAACTFAFPDACPTGFYCDDTNSGGIDGRCRPLPKQGEPCANPSLYPQLKCQGDLICVSGKGCQPPSHLGEACSGDTECSSGRCLEGECAPQDLCSQR